MKVKELIAMLQELDQEKNIWIYYDCYAFLEPASVETVSEDECWNSDNKAVEGDYYFDAW